MNKYGFLYLGFSIFSACTSVYLWNGILFQICIGRSALFVMPAVIAAFILTLAFVLHGLLAFLLIFRFVAEIREFENKYTLIALDGREIFVANEVKVLKWLKDPTEYTKNYPPILLAIFYADRVWVGNVPTKDRL